MHSLDMLRNITMRCKLPHTLFKGQILLSHTNNAKQRSADLHNRYKSSLERGLRLRLALSRFAFQRVIIKTFLLDHGIF